MTPPPDVWGARGSADTAPTPKPQTNPVYAPPSFYQPRVPAYPQQPVPPYQPPRSRAWIPILVLVLVIAFGGAIFGVRSIANKFRRMAAGEAPGKTIEAPPDVQLFDLNKGAKVSITTLNGSISVQAWDQPQAEVRIIKRGNSDAEAQSIPVTIRGDKNSLSLDASQGRNNSRVNFEIKLPRGLDLGAVRFASTNGPISVKEITGSIVVETTNGPITIEDVSGVEKVTTTNGTIKAQLDQMPQDRPMEFGATNGSIDLRFNSDLNATLEASTVHGSIDIDDDFNIPVQKSFPAGARAGGKIGAGGP
ncbi:MAG TPA: DUF4097 family beta strand repeat-containing protein, partial [Blastocatellia bacterium]|nr:DUF4097 family beta strand repeat-containing protein [Blastocatellia bacterium]